MVLWLLRQSQCIASSVCIGNDVASSPRCLVGWRLAIPVLIHLIQRERKRVVEFPSLMFLRQDSVPVGAPPADPRLAAAADAAGGAGADRRWRSRGRSSSATELAAAAQNGAREAVILVDTSYSMGYGDRWQRARTPPRATRSAGSAPAIARRWCSSRPAPKWRSARRRPRPARAGARGRRDRSRRDPLRAGAEARRQPARRVGAAAPRDHPDQRLPAPRLGADAGRDDVKLPERTMLTPVNVASRRDRQPLGDAGVAAAHALREPRSRRGHRRRRQPRRDSR